jgi:hypothetical protein
MTNDEGRKPEGAPERSHKAGEGARCPMWKPEHRYAADVAFVTRVIRSSRMPNAAVATTGPAYR